jgi:hypothetical protein
MLRGVQIARKPQGKLGLRSRESRQAFTAAM